VAHSANLHFWIITTETVEINAYQSILLVMGPVPKDFSLAATDVSEIVQGAGTESVTGLVYTSHTRAMETVLRTLRSVATTDASHHGSRGDTECAEISASTNIHSAMELVLRVTVLVENIGVSEMIQLISTSIAVIAASGRAPTLTIITDRAVTDVSTEISLRTSMNVKDCALAPVYFARKDQVNQIK